MKSSKEAGGRGQGGAGCSSGFHSFLLPLSSFPAPRPARRNGFTLLEVMIATVILAVAATIIWSTFNVTVKAYQRGTDMADRLNHGDFVIDQLTAAFRSTAFFANNNKAYGFWLDDQGSGPSSHDSVSWVTSSSAFIPPNSALHNGLHRIWTTVEDGPDGTPTFTVRALPHLKKELEERDAEPWHVSPLVQGFDCQVYDFEMKAWRDDWEETNKIPTLVQIKLYLTPLDEDEPAVEVSRVLAIPIAPAVTQAVAVGRGNQGGTNGVAAGAGGMPTVGLGGTPGGGGGRNNGNFGGGNNNRGGPGRQPISGPGGNRGGSGGGRGPSMPGGGGSRGGPS